MIVYLYY